MRSSRARRLEVAGGRTLVLLLPLLLPSVGCAASAREAQRKCENERQIAFWQAHEVERVAGARRSSDAQAQADARAVLEVNVPRVVCFDHSVSPTCSLRSSYQDCCIDHGGVYRDAWGNVVLGN